MVADFTHKNVDIIRTFLDRLGANLLSAMDDSDLRRDERVGTDEDAVLAIVWIRVTTTEVASATLDRAEM